MVLAAGIPILFLHVTYQPGISIGVGSTSVNAYLSDFAVLAIVLAALAEGIRSSFEPLRRGRSLWLVSALFLVWILVEVGLGHHHAAGYATLTHAISGAKFAEYALLAPAVPLVLRRATDVVLCAWSLVLWSVFATAVGIAQFLGADIFFVGTVGRRQASFLGSADFAALSTAALLVGVVCLALPRTRAPRALVVTALLTGVLGMIVAGALAAVLGLATALVVLAVALVLRRELDVRRLSVIAVAALIVLGGAIAIRGSDLDTFARFLGASPGTHPAQATKVQTYPQRTLLTWIGWQIWKHNAVAGVGWEGSVEPANFERYIPAARRHFPNVAPAAFPSRAPDHRYGVQDSWVQALADLGVVGFVLWVAVFAAAALLAARDAGPTALFALLTTAVLAWLWAAQSFVAGIPLDALTWLAFGLATTRWATMSRTSSEHDPNRRPLPSGR